MARVVFTDAADNDADEIVSYLAARGGPPTVRKYQRLFDQAYDRLRKFPRSGHPRPKLGPEVRIVIAPPYLIIYDWDAAADTVTVLRIIRGSRQITKRIVRG